MVAVDPQLKVTVPPPFTAICKASSVQLPDVPSPTTAPVAVVTSQVKPIRTIVKHIIVMIFAHLHFIVPPSLII
jgi:hypothetical protein